MKVVVHYLMIVSKLVEELEIGLKLLLSELVTMS